MNLTKRNIFLSIVLMFISVASFSTMQADFLDHKPIDLEQLHLYKIIISIKAIYLSERIEAIQQQGNSPKDFELEAQSPLKLVELALQEMKDIVIGLNNGVLLGNIEIEYKFVNLCTFLQNKKITPQALRELRAKISEFDCYLKEFCKKKKPYLTPKVFEHLNKMIRFNHMLIQGVLNDNYFDISMADLALDLIFYKPIQFANKHKFMIGGALLLACGVIAAIYGYPAYISYQLRNRNPHYPEMRQLHGFTQPAGSGDCGYYATIHTLLMMNAGPNTDPAAIQEHLNRISSINGVLARIKAINRGADWIDGDQLVEVLNQNVVQRFAADFQNIGLLPQNLDFQDIHMIENVEFLRNGQGIQQPLIDAVTRFRENNRPQGIVLLLAGNRANQHGHWVSLRLQRNAAGVLQPILINSQIRNITDYQIVNQVIQLFADQPMQSQYGLETIAPRLDAAVGILDNDAHNGTEVDRYEAATRNLAQSLQNIQAAQDGQQAQELAFYRDRITELFTRIRTDALRLNIHQVMIEGLQIDFDQIQNSDQFIGAIIGQPLA